MRTPWNPTDPFEIIIEQVEDAIDTMDSVGQPYTPEQIMTTAYLLVHRTGLFNDECKLWRRHPLAERNWANFKTQFLEAYRQLRADQTTTAGHLQFGQANNIAQQTAEALAAIASHHETGKLEMQQVQQANAALTQENASIAAKLAETNRALVDLTNLVQTMCNKTTTTRRRPTSGNYCWTHGFYCGKEHNSATCKNPAPGHQKDATAANRMGGSNRGDYQNK